MFSIPRVNVIESDEGFSVEVVGPTRLSYSEGSKVLTMSSELLEGPSGLVIYTRSIRNWQGGFEVDDGDKARIVDNIRRAFRYRGFEVEIM